MKTTIATAHSSHMKDNPKNKKLTIEMEGGSPYFKFIWINDVCYSLRIEGNGNTFSLHKIK